jgi:hypothetical protein
VYLKTSIVAPSCLFWSNSSAVSTTDPKIMQECWFKWEQAQLRYIYISPYHIIYLSHFWCFSCKMLMVLYICCCTGLIRKCHRWTWILKNEE